MKLIDIAAAVGNVWHLEQEEKMTKLLNRVQNYIEVTNETILTGGPGRSNLKGLMQIYEVYNVYQLGNPAFFHKLEAMI